MTKLLTFSAPSKGTSPRRYDLRFLWIKHRNNSLLTFRTNNDSHYPDVSTVCSWIVSAVITIWELMTMIIAVTYVNNNRKTIETWGWKTYRTNAAATAQPRKTFFSHCRVWPCSNNAGKTTWRRSNSSDSSLTGTSLNKSKIKWEKQSLHIVDGIK